MRIAGIIIIEIIIIEIIISDITVTGIDSTMEIHHFEFCWGINATVTSCICRRVLV